MKALVGRIALGAVLGLVCLLAGCASSKGARGDEESRLTEDNRKLRAELGDRNAAAQKAFAAASAAETQAGIAGASCSQVGAIGAPARGGAQHARVDLNGAFLLKPKFAGGRGAGPVQVTPAGCEVTR